MAQREAKAKAIAASSQQHQRIQPQQQAKRLGTPVKAPAFIPMKSWPEWVSDDEGHGPPPKATGIFREWLLDRFTDEENT